MGLLDWASSAWDYVSDAAVDVADYVGDKVEAAWDWVTDWFEDDSQDIEASASEYDDDIVEDTNDADFLSDGWKTDTGGTESKTDTSNDASGFNMLDTKNQQYVGDSGILGDKGSISASDVSTEKSTLFDKAKDLADGTSKKEKDDDKDSGWWAETKDVLKSEGGAGLVGGLAKGAYAMLTDGDELENQKALAKYKSDLVKDEYSYKYNVDNPAKTSSGSSSKSSSSSSESSSTSDRIATLAAAYPVKSNFKRS